jgi:HAD superfamily hydrolase (TIGR01509 family)
MPGATELVEACNDAGIPTAMVTMSYRSFAGAVAEAMPRGRFDVLVTGDEVARGKPDPEPYLAAARALGVEPTGCVALEDSPTGARSAEAAGCLTVVVPNHVEVPTTPSMVTLPTLSGVAPESLAALLSER